MNIGFVSTRFSGTDGVSLEAQKWAEAFTRIGHKCFWFSGLSDRPDKVSMVDPLAFFGHPEIQGINDQVWNSPVIASPIKETIASASLRLRQSIKSFCQRFKIDLLIPQNALTIPMNLPLGIALTEFIDSTGFPTVAHHHDFHWERERFSGSGVLPYLDKAFPPSLPSIKHVVINSKASKQLRTRLGLSSVLVPNVMDFGQPPTSIARFGLKSELGFSPEDILFLQPTRVVPRKGIEHAVELISRLNNPAIKLVISHESGDEGHGYLQSLEAFARDKAVDLRLIGDKVGNFPESICTLEELYPLADFVTYPSLYEGFGNALLETVYFRKPALVNRYPVYIDDIEPVGFDFVTMDGKITDTNVADVQSLLASPARIVSTTESNYQLGKNHYSFDRITTPLITTLSAGPSD